MRRISDLDFVSPPRQARPVGFVKMSSLSMVPTPALKDDIRLFTDEETLQRQGAMLIEHSAGQGRIIFSLQEVPLRVNFITPSGNRVQRVSDNRLYLATPDTQTKYKIEIDRSVNYHNKDQFLWAQSQSDLYILSHERLLSRGVTMREQISGQPLRIHSLKDLPLNTKYFTEDDNIVYRPSAHHVVIGDKTIPLTNSGNKKNTKALPVSQWSPTKQAHSALCSAKKLDDSKVNADFPRITLCQITGSGYHSLPLEVKAEYAGGVEGNSCIRWERYHEDTRSFRPIPGAHERIYRPSLLDIGTCVRVAYTPVRADGMTGRIVFSRVMKINILPEIKAEVESNLMLSALVFKVMLRNGSEFQKRSILLNRTRVKIRKRRTTLSKLSFHSKAPLAVEPLEGDGCLFSLSFSEKDHHVFLTPSSFQRDIIVLTIQAFHQAFSAPMRA